jgi:hypothetical protein
VSCVAAVHGIRAAMHSLKKTGTDFSSSAGMDPKAFFEVMGWSSFFVTREISYDCALHRVTGSRQSRFTCWGYCLPNVLDSSRGLYITCVSSG